MTNSDVKNFENIKEKIEALKAKKAKAEGAMETIQKEWEASYGVSSVEEITSLLETKKQEQQENEEALDAVYQELSGLTNWALV